MGTNGTEYQEQDITLAAGESKEVVFDSEFPEPPVVTMSLGRSGDGIPYVTDITTKGCVVHVWTPDLAPKSFDARVTVAMPGTYRTGMIA